GGPVRPRQRARPHQGQLAGGRTDVDQQRWVPLLEAPKDGVGRHLELGIELHDRCDFGGVARGHLRLLSGSLSMARDRLQVTRDWWSLQTRPDIAFGRKRVDFGGSSSPWAIAAAKSAGRIGGSQKPVPSSPRSSWAYRVSASER